MLSIEQCVRASDRHCSATLRYGGCGKSFSSASTRLLSNTYASGTQDRYAYSVDSVARTCRAPLQG